MPSKTFSSLLICSLILSSCKFECSVGGGKSAAKKGEVSSPKVVNGINISNNISLDVKGIKVKSAALQYEGGGRVPDDNVIPLGEKIYMVLQMDTTWTVENGKSFIGGSEKVSTNSGAVVMNAADLFADYSETGVDPVDAKTIRLSAVITKMVPGIDYFKVDFRAWDKKSDAEVTGNYKFYIQKD